MRLRTAWLCLPPALCLSAGIALAQDSTTTVEKAPTTTGTVVPAEAQEAPYDAAAPEPGDISPGAPDEGAGWDAAVEAAPASTPLLGAEQDAAVQRINAYFNGITNLQGTFEQIDSNNKRATGRFYVQRPGKLRFDYAPPSPLRIVADGAYLAIEDLDLKTIEKYPLKSTPFRLLLGDGVDLARDARIVGVESGDGSLAITVEDKNGEAAGQIRLLFEHRAGDDAEAVGDHRRPRTDDHGQPRQRRPGPEGGGRLFHRQSVIFAVSVISAGPGKAIDIVHKFVNLDFRNPRFIKDLGRRAGRGLRPINFFAGRWLKSSAEAHICWSRSGPHRFSSVVPPV